MLHAVFHVSHFLAYLTNTNATLSITPVLASQRRRVWEGDVPPPAEGGSFRKLDLKQVKKNLFKNIIVFLMSLINES
jgi:hypothetical protein